MTTIASLRILLGLDAGGVKSGASKVHADLKGVQQQAAATNASLMQIGAGLEAGIGLGAGLGAFAIASRGAAEFAGFLTAGVQAAQDDEASVARLTQALRENVEGWDGRTEAVDAAIKTGQRLGFSDDDLRNSLVRLSAATHDVNEAIRITAVAQDLARFKGVSLATATDALTKIEAGRFRGLADLGIALKAGTTQAEALAAVEKVAAGQAEIFGKTSAGAAEEAGVAMEEAGESIGRSLVPALKEASHFARDVLAPALTAAGDNMGTIALGAGALAIIVGGKLAVGLAASAAGLVASGVAAVQALAPTNLLAAAQEREALAANAAAIAEGRLALARAGAGGAAVTGAAASGAAAVAAGETAVGTAGAAAAAGGLGSFIAGLRALVGQGLASASMFGILHEVMVQNGTDTQAGVMAKVRLAQGLDAQGKATTGVTAAMVQQSIAMAEGNREALLTAAATAQLEAATNSVTPAQLRVAQATVDAAAAHADLANAQKAAAEAAAGDTSAIIALAGAMDADARATAELKAAQDALAASAVAVKAAMLGAGNGTDDLSDSLLRSANSARIAELAYSNAADQADRLKATGGASFTPGNIKIPGLDAEGNTGLPRDVGVTGPESFIEGLLLANQNAAAAAAREEERLRKLKLLQDDAAANAKRNAAETAAAYRERLGGAFDAVKRQAHEFFDALHERNLDAIRDIHDRANAELDAQQRAIRGAVDAERARVDAMRTHRQEINLRANVTAATDPADLARAQQALNDFLDDQRIAFLGGQADTQVAAIEAQKAANDKLAAVAIAAENERNQAQVAAFDFELAALQKKLSEHPKAWASTQQDILKLLMSFGVDYKKAGENLGQQFAAGLLSSTRAAEDAAKALAAAVGVPLGVNPAPAGGVSGMANINAASASVAQGLVTPTGMLVGGGKLGDVYLDGEKVGEFIERRQSKLEGIYAPTPVSTGSQR